MDGYVIIDDHVDMGELENHLVQTHRILGLPGVFVNTAGDLTLLLRVLEAASRFERRPSDGEIAAMLDSTRITSLFGLAI